MKIIIYMCTAVEETNVSDPRSYEHYWTSSWNKTWKKFGPVRVIFLSFCALIVSKQQTWINFYLIKVVKQ